MGEKDQRALSKIHATYQKTSVSSLHSLQSIVLNWMMEKLCQKSDAGGVQYSVWEYNLIIRA